MRKIAALTLAFSCLVGPALANDLETDSEETEQVIPPAIVDENSQSSTEPLDLDEIEITTKTPADEFVNATTPLLVALMLGSVGLVIVTLVSQSKRENSRLD